VRSFLLSGGGNSKLLAPELGYRTAQAEEIESEFAAMLQQIAAAVPSRTLIQLPGSSKLASN
jgi:hypothetical protein